MLATRPIESSDPAQDATATLAARTSRDRRRIVWAVVGLASVFVLALGVAGVVGRRPCASCHDRGAFQAQTQASPHADVDCRACHMSPGAVGQAVFAVQRPLHAYFPQARTADRDAASVPDSRCRACHAKALEGVVDSNGVKVNHASCATKASCTDCHSSTAHGSATQWIRSYDMDACLECHMASRNMACNLCHLDRKVAASVASSASPDSHGPKWKTTHGMGDAATCNVCHKAPDCAECHGAGVPHEAKFVGAHASYAAQPTQRCASCHNNAFCDSCHGTQMPHPAGFTQRHAAAAKEQPGLCKRCHAESDCTNCHAKHAHPGGTAGKAVPGVGGR
jgi:hypothetical protein